MDFPIFHLDFLGNRLLIAIIAILHTVINHPMAVGGLPLIALLEWQGYRTGNCNWDRIAYRVLFIFFLITTTVGALTGVGIWLSASLINPTAIGSLIRVFFWAWFTEWIVFVTEVSLILLYYLTWERWNGAKKRKHILLGFILGLASWITMVLIVAILSFMMDPGSWLTDRSFLSGVFNPIYGPQLFFRTPLAMVMAGAAVLAILALIERDNPIRNQIVRFVSRWMLFWMPVLALGSYSYWSVIPNAMVANMGTALTTMEFSAWYSLVLYWALGSVSFVLVFAALGSTLPRALWRPILPIPFVLLAFLLGQFERVREFIRKPYAIAGYLYANGIRKDDYPLLRRDGLLRHSPYSTVKQITPENRLLAGKELFTLACTRCHTVNGINSVRTKLTGMYGNTPWNENTIASYLAVMHQTRSFMPPFPGNAEERNALAHYLAYLQSNGDVLDGAQTAGTTLTGNGVTNK